MLNAVFVWLDSHPGIYWTIAWPATFLLFSRIWSAWRTEERNRPSSDATAIWWDALTLFTFLLAWRWPFLLSASEFNPDESQLIAGAITLTHDPVFWRSVDGATSGPLNFYILLPWQWLGLPLDYFTARLTGLLLIWGALFACYRTLAGLFGSMVGWLSVLPAVLFFATATHFDLIHYSSEHLTLLLCALAIWSLTGRKNDEAHRLWIGCFIAGSALWAKLQAAPLVVVLVGWGIWQVTGNPSIPWRIRWQRAAGAGIAGLAPTLLTIVLIIATGQTETAYRRYFVHNVLYVGNARSFRDAFHDMAQMAMSDGRLPWFLATVAVLVLAASIFYSLRRQRPPEIFIVGGLLSLAAVVAIVTPRREFLHYTLLLPVPLTVWAGGALGGWRVRLKSGRHAQLLVALALLTFGLVPLITRALQPVADTFGQFAYDWRHPRSSAAEIVHALARKKGSLGIWGWACYLNVETALPQATREGNSIWCIMPNAQRDYHRTSYLADLRRNEPSVFVDAVGPDSFGFKNRTTEAHEIFPELAEYIELNYKLVTDLGDVRIYARNGLTTIQALTPARLTELGAYRRFANSIATPVTANQFQRKIIARRNVIMLLPPAKIEWQLDEDVRKITVGFGFDPVAYIKGKSNGAELILELVNHGQTRPLYRHYLNPSEKPEDRDPQNVMVSLPPFSAGTHLVLRTDPGPYGDTAWDWVYLDNLQLTRSPSFLSSQFPGFNRVPDSADADNSWLDSGKQLLLPAPSSFTYILSGKEKHLAFDYGFQPGAYSNGGNTDGAIFRVESTRAGQAAHTVFERYLQPLNRPEDRGPQHVDLTIGDCLPDAHLKLSIDPGPAGNTSWDWTFISNLSLD